MKGREKQEKVCIFCFSFHEFLSLLEKRKTNFDTLLVAFMLKTLGQIGMAPRLDTCINCGKTNDLNCFSIADGGLICKDCADLVDSASPLIFELSDGIINVMRYIQTHPLRSLEGLALPDQSEKVLKQILKAYYSYHLGIENLKSEGLLI